MRKIKSALIDNLLLSFKEIWSFNKRIVFLLVADVIVKSISPFPRIVFSGIIVDSVAAGKDFSTVVYYVIGLFLSEYFLTITKTFFSKTREYQLDKLTYKLDNEINSKCLNMDYERFNDPSTQDRIQLVNQAIRGKNFFTNLLTVFDIVSRCISLLGLSFVLVRLNTWLLLIAVFVIGSQAFLHFVRLKYNRRHNSDLTNDLRKITYVSQLPKDTRCKKDILMFNMSEYILNKIQSFEDKMLSYEKRRIQINGCVEMAAYSLSVVFQVSAYLLIGIEAFNGNISVGDFTVGITSLINFMSMSSSITMNIITFNDSFFYIRQYQSFKKSKSKQDKKHNKTIDEIDLSNIKIEFRNVSFRYPNSTAFVLKNVNLTIDNNERLAIVGFNGAGKTSLVLLLTRMYDPTEGSIFLNGIDIREINYNDYQKIFSTVNQDFFLSAFSLIENITFKEHVSESERSKIENLFNKNGMDKRLKKMYRGLDTPVTKKLFASGVDLSGGESQKIAIIRSIYKNAPILILDEPTAALDPVAESEIFQNFATMSKGKTAILISHRIYSTRFCDKIAVFEKGEIKEYGSYEELMALKGLYYDFFEKQAEYFRL